MMTHAHRSPPWRRLGVVIAVLVAARLLDEGNHLRLDPFLGALRVGPLESGFIGAGLAWAWGSLFYTVATLRWFGRMDTVEFRQVLRTSGRGATNPSALRVALTGMGGTALSAAMSHALMGLVLVVGLANLPGLKPYFWVRLLAVAVVTSSWVMVLLTQALAYARLHAQEGEEHIAFAGTDRPVFEDYVALASGISTMLGHADVTTSGRRARRMVRNHALVSFGFNSMVVATWRRC